MSDVSIRGNKKTEIITLCTHTNFTLNPENYCIVSLYYYCFYML